MEPTLQRNPTLYTKDVIPARALRHINNVTDIDSALNEQLSSIKKLENEKVTLRNELVSAISVILDSADSMSCAVLGAEFLQQLLDEVMVEEKSLRAAILGKQECVEMFKTAVGNNEVSSSYLETSRMQRDDISAALFGIVDAREKVFTALEVVKRTSHNVDLQQDDTAAIALKHKHKALSTQLSQEHEKLKLLTEWKRHPEKMHKQRKKVKQIL